MFDTNVKILAYKLDSPKFINVMPLSPPFAKGDLGGFQQVIAKSPLTPLCERGELAIWSFQSAMSTLDA